MKVALESDCWAVESAMALEQAQAKFETGTYSLLIVSAEISPENGAPAFCRRIREGQRDLAIIVTSTSEDLHSVAAQFPSKRCATLAKPMDAQQLRSLAREIVSGISSDRPSAP